MIDIKLLRNNPKEIKSKLALKGIDPKLVDKFLDIDDRWRKIIYELDELKAKQNALSEELAKIPKKESLLKKAKELKEKIEARQSQFKEIEKSREKLLFSFPNLPLDDVPQNKEGVVLKEVGDRSKFSAKGGSPPKADAPLEHASGGNFSPKSYLELAERYDLIDLERAAKVAGSRFGYLKNEAALLEIALINFAFDFLVKKKVFIPVFPPVMLKPEIMRGMGYLDQAPEEIYFLPEDKLFLAGTAEHPLIAMHAGETFQEDELPKRYVAFSTCFRREAGSYGKDVKGIMRVHQFDKIEMVSFCTPETSEKEHEFLLGLEEDLVSALKLPYRVTKLSAQELAFPSAKTYDIECWLPSEEKYRETHSCSNCTDFQARRLNIRYKATAGNKKETETKFVHTLNGTALAIGRTLIAILENYQTKEGTIFIPEVLKPYLNLQKIG